MVVSWLRHGILGAVRLDTRTYSRILRPGLGRILPELSQSNGRLRHCFDKLDQEVKSWVEEAKLAA